MSLKENIKELRKKEGLTQKEISNKLNISLRTYTNYENGSVEPNLKILTNLADYFNVSVDYIIGHRQNNKIDLSGLSKAQRNAINIICELNELNSNKVEAYAQALLSEQK